MNAFHLESESQNMTNARCNPHFPYFERAVPPILNGVNPDVKFEQENRDRNENCNVGQTSARRPPLKSLSLNMPNQTAGCAEYKPDVGPKQRNSESGENLNRHRSSVRVSRRNERERNRVKLINMGFERLRSVVPCHSGEQLSKISTLRKAIWYIEHLDRVLHGQDRSNCGAGDNSQSSISNQSITQLSTDAMASPWQGYSSTSVDHPARQHSSRSTSRIDMSTESGKVGAGEAVRMASWSSTDTPLGLNRRVANSGGRPAQTVTTKVPSPIFPTQWGRHVGLELTSTPKLRTLAGSSKTEVTGDYLAHDSGYASISLTGAQPGALIQNGSNTNHAITSSSLIGQPLDWAGYRQHGATPSQAINLTSLSFYSWLGNT